MDPDGSITVIANTYHSRRLNRPNDVVVKSDGSVYFTDPMTFNVESELDFCGVYRVSPDLGTIHVLARDFVLPNGLCFSPDESILYVNDSRRRHIRAFDVEPTGLVALASGRLPWCHPMPVDGNTLVGCNTSLGGGRTQIKTWVRGQTATAFC
jgi:gluconolactonase